MKFDEEFNQFIIQHEPQLVSSQIPEIYWKKLFEKLKLEIFNAGDVFQLIQIDYDDDEKDPYDPTFQLQIKANEGIHVNDSSQIYLVDHAWTFRVDQAKQMLSSNDMLLQRMANIMSINTRMHKEESIDAVFDELWKFCNTYSVASAENIEDRMPVWYIMDEVGSAIRHSDSPNFRMVPFIYIDQHITYSLIFPIKDCEFTDVVTRNFLEKDIIGDERMARILPWVFTDFKQMSFKHLAISPDYFLSGHMRESLPVIDNLNSKSTALIKPLKVYSEYVYIHKYLVDENFQLVDNEDEADILWYTSHFKKFEELSTNSPHKFVNQFPFEYILTIKDLLCIVCRLKNTAGTEVDCCTLEMLPKWLPITYNLNTEIVQFVSYFQNREAKHLDNHWIIKPFNLARGLDTHITNNVNFILRMSSSGPKIAQKYIDRPVLFERPGIGKVKFDIRYVILLKSIEPLTVYVYNNFFLRFANQAFSLNDLHIYEKHFTVMNYNDQAELKHMQCAEFQQHWKEQLKDHPWEEVEKSIHEMLRQVFECATTKPPPCGISTSPQSRALYAADIMLEYNQDGDGITPKLLEINWMPDCKRACEYYENFYNDIFKLLFLNMNNDLVFTRL